MAAVQPSYVGIDMVLAYNSAGPGLGPTLVAIGAKDVKRGRSKTKAEVTNRKLRKKLYEPGGVDEEITFAMVYDETDAAYVFLRTAFDANTAVEFWFANGPLGTAGTSGSGGTANVVYNKLVMKVFQFDEDQPLDGSNETSITIAPCFAAIAHADVNNTLVV